MARRLSISVSCNPTPSTPVSFRGRIAPACGGAPPARPRAPALLSGGLRPTRRKGRVARSKAVQRSASQRRALVAVWWSTPKTRAMAATETPRS